MGYGVTYIITTSSPRPVCCIHVEHVTHALPVDEELRQCAPEEPRYERCYVEVMLSLDGHFCPHCRRRWQAAVCHRLDRSQHYSTAMHRMPH